MLCECREDSVDSCHIISCHAMSCHTIFLQSYHIMLRHIMTLLIRGNICRRRDLGIQIPTCLSNTRHSSELEGIEKGTFMRSYSTSLRT